MSYSVIKMKKKGEIKSETPKIIWIDQFICLRSKACSFKCNDENTNEFRVFSKFHSKNFKI